MLLKTLFITFLIWIIPATNHVYAQQHIIQQPNIATHAIQFIEQDWNVAKQMAKQENKLIFVDVYATWCPPCMLLKNKTFRNKKVGDFFNQHFVNVSVDAEKGIGIQVARYFGVTAYPTLVFTDASGKPVLYAMGYMGTKDILKFAQAALNKAAGNH
jgi:thioredoxin-related protein